MKPARRNRVGEYVNRWGINASPRTRILEAYNAYIQAMTERVEDECKGVLVRKGSSHDGWRVIDPRQRIAHKWRSEECQRWIAAHGEPLTYTAFKDQCQEEPLPPTEPT